MINVHNAFGENIDKIKESCFVTFTMSSIESDPEYRLIGLRHLEKFATADFIINLIYHN